MVTIVGGLGVARGGLAFAGRKLVKAGEGAAHQAHRQHDAEEHLGLEQGAFAQIQRGKMTRKDPYRTGHAWQT